MKKILIFLFFVVSSAAFAQPPYTASGFTYNGHTYKVSIVGDGIGQSSIVINNILNKAGTYSPLTGNYLDCFPNQVFDVRYLHKKAIEAINGAIDAQTRQVIRNNEFFDILLTVTKENKVEVKFFLHSNTIITPEQIYAMDMAIRQIPITFNPTGDCVGINLSTISTGINFLPKLDQ